MENRKSKLKHLKRYESFMNEELTSAAPAPVKPGIDTPTKPKQPTKPSVPRPSTNPDTGPKFMTTAPVKPGIDTPTKPMQPTKPSVPRPSTNPDTGPKFEEEALKKLVSRVKDSLDEKGEKIEDLIKKQ